MSEHQGDLHDHGRIDDGLNATFGGPEGSALDAIERLSGTRLRILLGDAPEDASPVLRLPALAEERALADDSRYQVLGEIGRGGMGTVYKGRDKDLGRDVALKVLRADLAQEPAVVQRFVEEAQVGGQLQHPGIVPIYGLGLQKEGRPYFAMKLVKGETLASLLEGGGKGSELIRLFERVAQTVAYAHSRGVIHRDLKPSNVMVGAFGEVHVVDWGFAKVLGREETHGRPGTTVVATVRTGAEGSQSVAGSVMGTPAYMPPEQALGQVEELTERSDVFALGAILCEILTRQPPYTGTMQDQFLAAAHARLEEAYGRLDACSAPDALKHLARDCLRPLPKDRPKDAGVVAHRVAEHLASVEERARQAELDAVHAAAEARRIRRGRRTTVALAAVALVAILGGSGGLYAWRSAERARASGAAAQVAPLLREATHREGEANWPAAHAAATTALALAETGGADAQTLSTVRALKARIGAEAEAAKAREQKLARETRLLHDLEELRMQSKDLSAQQRESRNREAFAAFGVDPEAEGAAALAEFGRPVELAIHLDWWVLQRRRGEGDRWKVLDRLARVLDDDPWRTRVRDTVQAGDAAALRDLADEADPAAQSAATIVLLANYLQKAGDAEAAAALLRRSVIRHPADLWIHDALAGVLWWDLGRAPEAMSHAQAAVALRPQSGGAWSNLGAIRNDGLGDHDGAIRAFRRALELAPGSAVAHANLGQALRGKGDLDGALAACREAIRLDPGVAEWHAVLGTGLGLKGDLDGALAAFREAIRLDPECAAAHAGLGLALGLKGDLDGALAASREAIRLDPGVSEAHRGLGLALQRKADLDGALAAYREALRLDPRNHAAYINMGGLLCDRLGRHDEAIAAFREAIRINPNDPKGYANLGIALAGKGDAEGAVVALREALRLAPDASVAYCLGNALRDKGDSDGALAAYREALRLDPDNFAAYINMGGLLGDRLGRHDEAVAAFREAIRINPNDPKGYGNLGSVLRAKGDVEGAIAAFREALRFASDADIARNLGDALDAKGDVDGAVAAYREAVRIDPDDCVAYALMGVLLCDRLGRYDEAIAAFREALRIDPNEAQGYNNLGTALRLKGDLDGAVAALREAIRLGPSVASLHSNLGLALLNAGDFQGAAASYREALRLDPSDFSWHNNLGYALVAAGDLDGAVAAYREALRLDPKNYRACIDVGVLLCDRLGRFDEAIAAFREAIRIDANQWAGHTYLGVALLNKGEFLDSLKALRKAATLETPVAGWLESLIRRVERLAAAQARLPAVLKGEDRPASGQEWVSFAEVLYHRKDHVSAMRYYAKGFEADARVAADLDAQYRCTAACCAVLAGKEWHGQALAWLRAELDANVASLASAAPAVAGRMRQWKSDRDLAGVRDVDGLSEEWRALWADVDALLRRAEEASK